MIVIRENKVIRVSELEEKDIILKPFPANNVRTKITNEDRFIQAMQKSDMVGSPVLRRDIRRGEIRSSGLVYFNEWNEVWYGNRGIEVPEEVFIEAILNYKNEL
jgi:hypothetical protein